MLSDEVIDKVVERLVNRIEQANVYILKEIGRSIKEIGTINPTKARQLVQTLKYGGDYEKIVKEIAKITNLNVKDIQEIFEEVAKSDYLFAKQFYDYRGKRYIPYEHNKALKDQVEALAKITAEEYINLTRTTALGFAKRKNGRVVFQGMKDAYYDLLDEAVLSVHQGKETFDSAMYRQLKDLADSGLRVVYPTTYIGADGKEHNYTRRLDSATRMNMKSALRNLHNEIEKQIGEEFGANGVEISAHENPAPDHQEAQGKQFSYKEYNKLQTTGRATTYDKIEVDMHRGKHLRPISEWNCYHYTFSIVLGVNVPRHSKEQLQEIIDRNNKGFDYEGKHYTMYEGTQLQRQIETAVRREKDKQITGVASGNQELIAESQHNIKALTRKYKELNEVSGLRPKVERMKVEGYQKVKNNELENPRNLETKGLTSITRNLNSKIDPELKEDFYNYTNQYLKEYDEVIPEKEITWKAGEFTSKDGEEPLSNEYFYVNKKVIDKKEKFANVVVANQKNGMLVKTDNPIKQIIGHEIGHRVQIGTYRKIYNKPKATRKESDVWTATFMSNVVDKYYKDYPRETIYISEALSNYGARNYYEMFSEAFAEYTCSSNPRPFAKTFGIMLEEVMRKLK